LAFGLQAQAVVAVGVDGQQVVGQVAVDLGVQRLVDLGAALAGVGQAHGEVAAQGLALAAQVEWPSMSPSSRG
jgi:hypothetical protein